MQNGLAIKIQWIFYASENSTYLFTHAIKRHGYVCMRTSTPLKYHPKPGRNYVAKNIDILMNMFQGKD
jgi:hypothetical protein